MNPNNEIKFNFKADLTDLKNGVDQAKQSLNDLKQTSEGINWDNFNVNWGESSGNLQEYNEYLSEAAQKQSELAESNEAVAQTLISVSESTGTAVESESQMEQETSLLSNAFEKLKQTASGIGSTISDGFTYGKEAAEGYITKLNESSQGSALLYTTTRTARAGFVALAAAITSYAKSSLDEYANSNAQFAATQERVNGTISQLKASFGAVLASLYPIIDSVAQWLYQNRELVTTLAAAAAGVVAMMAAVKAITVAISVAKAMTSGWLGVLSLIAGVAAAAYVGSMDLSAGISDNSAKIAELQSEMAEIDAQIEKTGGSGGTVSAAGNNISKQIAKIQKQIEKTKKDYLQSLKQIAINHEETVADLTRQIEEANVDYQRAVDERNAAFKVSQAEEAEEHQAKVDELMNQINFLQRYNNKYNKEKLEQLQFALAREEALYKQRTAAEEEELRIQNEAEKVAHEQKLASLQAELADELAFQNKHREELNLVRDVILQDEIEALNAQRDAQLASYAEQIADAYASGASAGNAYTGANLSALQAKKAEIQKQIDELMAGTTSAYNNGAKAGKSYGDGAISAIWNHLKSGGVVSDIWKWLLGDERYERWTTQGISTGWATGGFTGKGNPNEVAGFVHKGEYVLPADMVDQATGMPKVGASQNIVINVNGTFATSASERRKVAEQIASALNQTSKARLGA